MLGYFVYTRAWYSLGATRPNAGTFVCDLTDGIFGSSTAEAVSELEEVCGSVPDALLTDEGSTILRILSLNSVNARVVVRSSLVVDLLTGHDARVKYSFGLIFTDADAVRWCYVPEHSFSAGAYEPYADFAKRVSSASTHAPLRGNSPYAPQFPKSPTVVPRRRWRELGFSDDSACAFISALLRVLTTSGATLQLLLPRTFPRAAAESVILAALTLLPGWVRPKLTAVSAWHGAVDGAAARAVGNAALVCATEPLTALSRRLLTFGGLLGNAALSPDAPGKSATLGLARWLWAKLEAPLERFDLDKALTSEFGANALLTLPLSTLDDAARRFVLRNSGSPTNV